VGLLLDKLFDAAISPLSAALILGLFALALSFTRFRKSARTILALTLIGLWIAATPAFAHWLADRLQRENPPRAAEDLPSADAIVLLGGFLKQPLPPRIAPDLTAAADRAVEAARLYRAGKAQRIVVSGGNLPWRFAVAPEAELVADLLVELGVPRDALVLETASRNTRENAVNTARIFAEHGWKSGLLVTSGLHMKRALGTFRQVGLDLTPAPADIPSRLPEVPVPFDVLPDVDALDRTTTAIHEIVGLIVYRYRGWAKD
jgi:uncharacterized SAM-binding protein YcdF (DUF218 family)